MPIEEIKIGDKVWAYNEANQSKSLQEVTHLIRGEGDKALVDITLSDGEIITATSNHPFWAIDSQEWLEAGELTNRSILLNINDKNTTIKSLKHYAKNKKVYNLTIANDHTYYVGVGGVLGHNARCTKGKPDKDGIPTTAPNYVFEDDFANFRFTSKWGKVDKFNHINDRFPNDKAKDWAKFSNKDNAGQEWHWYERRNRETEKNEIWHLKLKDHHTVEDDYVKNWTMEDIEIPFR